jgi:hypothetical protein
MPGEMPDPGFESFLVKKDKEDEHKDFVEGLDVKQYNAKADARDAETAKAADAKDDAERADFKAYNEQKDAEEGFTQK